MIQLENGKRVLEQWALNQRVNITGCEAGTRVEFEIAGVSGYAPLPVAAYEEDGLVYADVPNILLQRVGYINVRVCPSANVPQLKAIRVVRREKPEDYEYSETELLKTADELLEKVKSDPLYAALLEEIRRLNFQCKNYALLCNKILQDCERIKKEIGGDGK